MKSILPKLAKVKANLSGVKKDVKNTFFKSSYADLNAHLDAVEPLLEENGLVLVQPVYTIEGSNYVKTVIYDVETGESVESCMKLVGDADMQKVGSAVTYARRYTLGSLLGMKAVDDDGEMAVGRGTTKSSSATTTNKKGKASFNKNKAKAAAEPTTTEEAVVVTGDDL